MELVDTTSWQPWQMAYKHGMLNIWPPDGVRQYLNGFRAELDPVSQAISEAHITLTQPFLSSPTDETWSEISDLLRGFRPFELLYGPVRSFLPAPVIWLEVQPSSIILALRKALHNLGDFDLTLPHTDDFVAHMTLTEGLSNGVVDEVLLNRLMTEVSSGTFSCKKVAYVVPNSAFEFSVQKTFELGVR